MRTKKVPHGARHLRAYEELTSYLINFTQGLYPFLWIVGRPGVGKSEAIKAALPGRSHLYQKGGQITPMQFYIACHQHRGEPIVLDDAEHLLDTTVGAKLISALGDTTTEKLLCYATTGRGLGEVPQRFYTTSPLCILANRSTRHEDIQSRAVTLYFDPTNQEIHRAAAQWYWDQEIHNWFGEHLSRLPPLDTRWYRQAFDDKRAGRKWQQVILTTRTLNRATCTVQDVERDDAYPTREEKVRRFVEVMGNTKGGSRASYFSLRKRLKKEQRLVVTIIPPIQLRHTRPPATPSILELDALEAPGEAPPEEDPSPLDVPLREAFSQPITGAGAAAAHPTHAVLDDSVAWEDPPEQDDEQAE
jgi:hypothetical protein